MIFTSVKLSAIAQKMAGSIFTVLLAKIITTVIVYAIIN
jgi:hypothetical protein